MYNIDIRNQRLFFKGEKLNFKKTHGLLIEQVLIYENLLFIRGYPINTDSRSSDFVPYDKNNVFAFNEKGKLLWQKGKRSEISQFTGRAIEHPCEYIKFDGDLIKLYYQTNYEVWHNLETGEKIKEEFVFKK